MTDETPALNPEIQARRDRWQHNLETAARIHQQDYRMQSDMLRSVLDFAQTAVRTTTLISGGAVVVSLAFVGSVYTSEPELARRLMLAVIVFAVGALLGGASAGFAYLAQFRYTEASGHKEHTFEHPYVKQKPEAEKFENKGKFWHGWAVATVIASYLSLIAGLVVAWCAINGQTP